MKLKEDKI